VIKGPLLFFQVFEKVKTKSGWNCQLFCGIARLGITLPFILKCAGKNMAVSFEGVSKHKLVLNHCNSLGGDVF